TDPFAAGRQLDVCFVIDGIVRFVGDSIRMTCQLLNVRESSVVWSASFSRDYGDILELEDSLSEEVSKQLLPRLTGDEQRQLAKRGTDNRKAYESYLQGRYFWSRFEPDSFPKSIAAFRRAVELDPNFALAHVGIADFHAWAAIYGLVPTDIALKQTFESANRALELDPTLAEAYAALGLYYSNMQQWEKAEQTYRKSIELNPNYPLAHEWLSSILVATAQFDEGLRELRTAEELDPLSLRPKVLSAWTLYQAREFDAALKKGRELLSLDTRFMQSHVQTANILLEMGRYAEALHHSTLAVEIEPDTPLPFYAHCYALVKNGRRAEAEQLAAHWEERAASGHVPAYFLAMARLALGDTDAAIKYLDAARLEHSAWTIWFSVEPKLDVLRDDPRFQEIIVKMNGPILPANA
ncbi:MAG: tetratricopeptide repeat protein, partial [Pyrinomonadaceae bacterium]|nr:tetratricopeptide repeat protein [Pyrinomonadaceae bacterium]